jgi:hypothetical protein
VLQRTIVAPRLLLLRFMQRDPKHAKDPDEIREPQRRTTDVVEDEEGIEADAPSRVKRPEADEEDLAEDEIMEELDEDDLRGMEGPDA